MRVLFAVGVVLIVAPLFISAATVTSYGQWTSCNKRCGDREDTGYTCQCNPSCEAFDDCCFDYVEQCESCVDRCGSKYDKSRGCQCNDSCEKHKNCCKDYKDKCSGSGGGTTKPNKSITDEEIKQLTAKVWNLDTGRFASNQLYTSTSSDDELFTYVREDLLHKGTWPSFKALLDNFTPDVRVNENRSTQKRQEEDRFLNAIFNTQIMTVTWQTLRDHGYVSNNINEFKNEMRQWWFQNYSRSRGKYGSSGFEHIFCGEIKEGGVIGFHNWLSFYLHEKKGSIDYLYHKNTCPPNSMAVSFKWMGYRKPITGLFIGSSPEFELAIYTICFLTRPNESCAVSLDGRTRKVLTHRMFAKGGLLTVGSAYPLC